MNKEKKGRLTATDRAKIAAIGGNLELMSSIIGDEPSIYYDFSFPLSNENNKISSLDSHRKAILSNNASSKIKK